MLFALILVFAALAADASKQPGSDIVYDVIASSATATPYTGIETSMFKAAHASVTMFPRQGGFDLESTSAPATAAATPRADVEADKPNATLFARQQGTPQCKAGFDGDASAYVIEQGINDLKNRDPSEDCNLGPGECQILQCSYNAAIQWCNRNDEPRGWKCRDFWSHAQGILSTCSYSNFDSTVVWGMEHDEQNFDVWIGRSPC